MLPKTVLYSKSLLHVLPSSLNAMLNVRKNCGNVFSTVLACRVGESRAACTWNFVRIFLFRVFKEQRVQIYPKVFVNDHRCRCSILLGSRTLQLHIWRQAANSIASRDVENFNSVTIKPTRIIRVKIYPINQK